MGFTVETSQFIFIFIFYDAQQESKFDTTESDNFKDIYVDIFPNVTFPRKVSRGIIIFCFSVREGGREPPFNLGYPPDYCLQLMFYEKKSLVTKVKSNYILFTNVIVMITLSNNLSVSVAAK